MTKQTVFALHPLIEVVHRVREIDPEMQLQQVLTFLEVAKSTVVTMTDITDRVGCSTSSTSRNVAALSKVHRKGQPGHDLVHMYDDPMDRRRKIVGLTPKGEKLKTELMGILSKVGS